LVAPTSARADTVAGEVTMTFQREHKYCVHDMGRLESVGRFVTHSVGTIEIVSCPFDGYISGFQWRRESGWEPVFVWHEDPSRDAMVISLLGSAQGNLFLEEEIAFELACFFDERRSRD
jgi:hypothetical protein